MLKDWLKEAAKDADQERALKDVIVATAKDKGKIAEGVEKRKREVEKAWVLAE